jgi:hypothetical protein
MSRSSETELAQEAIPERAYILLFVLSQLKAVYTELKLQKLVFQVQNKAKISGGYRYFKHYYGPYSRELTIDALTLINQGLIQRETVLGREYPYSVFRISERGKAYFEESVLPKLPSANSERMRLIVDEYSQYTPHALAEAVYKQWEIEQPSKIDSETRALETDLHTMSSFWETQYFPECPAVTYYLAFIEYSQDALEKVVATRDPVTKSVLLNACSELNQKLGGIAEVCSKKSECPAVVERDLCRNPDPSVYEVFGFIEDFCERQKILPKLWDRDLHELMTGDEYGRLKKVFQTFDTSSSS